MYWEKPEKRNMWHSQEIKMTMNRWKNYGEQSDNNGTEKKAEKLWEN